MAVEKNLIIVDADDGHIVGKYIPKKKRVVREGFLIDFYVENRDLNLSGLSRLIIAQMDSNNRLVVNSDKIKYLNKCYGFKEMAVRQSLKRMISAKILVKTGISTYFVNPFRFAKTNFTNIEVLRVEFGKLVSKVVKEKKVKNVNPKELKLIKTEAI